MCAGGLAWHISIRTPAWGVTAKYADGLSLIFISIRTPAWGVTSDAGMMIRQNEFQFAPPRGG